ncbi:hypothetical protein K3729_08155 [Rhodobacteraceae bacterium S2214]|nr:hypothetical protein K3729_08155 [Rhodobacteraceae bacterium S2214]
MTITKVGTCCYCGTKAALVLRGSERHELSCSTCGAPLHALKILPQRAAEPARLKAVSHRPKPQKVRDYENAKHRVKPGKRRKSKSLGRKIWSEVWDVVEDIFD